jgi:hypothetical protein
VQCVCRRAFHRSVDDDLEGFSVVTPSPALANAGISVLATIPSAPGGATAPTLLAELYVFFGDSVTSRFPLVRSADARATWLASQLATLGPTTRYYAVVGPPSSDWLYIDAPDPGWLARLWATRPSLVLLLSDDGTRLLMLLDVAGIPDTLALAHPTSDVLALRDDRARLDEALSSVPALLRVAAPPARVSIRTDDLFVTPAFTIPAFSTEQRLETWFVDAFERWRTSLEDRAFAGHLGPYEVSLASATYVGTLAVYAKSPADLALVWANSGRRRLVLLDSSRTRALAFSCTDDQFEARMTVL